MPNLDGLLELERCPHCGVSSPNLISIHSIDSTGMGEEYRTQRSWNVYRCQRCGDLVTAWSEKRGHTVKAVFPSQMTVEPSIPRKAGSYLSQALGSFHTPAGAVMLAASSVDAMLKDKGYMEGTLNQRINKAAADHLITTEMAAWAHEIRLDANDQRHADEDADLPDPEEAQKTVDFALALAEFLYVLPARVERGRSPNSP